MLSLWLSLAPACGFFSSRHSESTNSAASSDVLVQVESHHWNDVVIYVMNGGQAQRLGMVAVGSTSYFVFPYRWLAAGGRIRLRAYPVGGQGSYTSEDVVLQPGQGLKWTLESDLKRSSLSLQ